MPRNSWASPNSFNSSCSAPPSSGATSGLTLVKEAVIPVLPVLVSTMTGPAGVSNSKAPVPSRSASTTAVAIVACPQNGTSATGEKERMCRWRGFPARSRSVTKAVSA